MDSTCSYMGRSLQPPAPYMCPSTLLLRSQRSQAQPFHPLKILAAHPASTLAGGSSLAFLPLHSLPCTAARRLFLKGKADLVPALGQPSSSMSSAKRSRLDRVLETSAPSVNSRSLIRGGIACRLLHLGFSHLPYRNLKN